MLAQLGAMCARLAAHVGPSGAMLGQRRRILGLMLSHVDPSGATRAKKEESQGTPPLSYGEERMPYGSAPRRRTQGKVDLGFLHDIL